MRGNGAAHPSPGNGTRSTALPWAWKATSYPGPRRRRDAEQEARESSAAGGGDQPGNARAGSNCATSSPDLIARLRLLLSRRTPPEELVVWRLRLFCGHVATRHA